MTHVLFAISFLLWPLSAGAQTFTERIQQKGSQGEGKVTVSHSTAIDKLVNGKWAQQQQAAEAKKAQAAETKQEPVRQEEVKKSPTKQEPVKQEPLKEQQSQREQQSQQQEHRNAVHQEQARRESTRQEPVRQETDTASTVVDTRKKVMRKSYRVTGYRVQAYAGGNQRKDRQRAEQIGNDIKMNYPEEPIYVHFYSPRWICRVGNYRTYEEAHQMLLNIRRLGYNSATIVKGKISIQY